MEGFAARQGFTNIVHFTDDGNSTGNTEATAQGVNLVCERVICTETPDDAALDACCALGKALAEREMIPAADGYFSGGDAM